MPAPSGEAETSIAQSAAHVSPHWERASLDQTRRWSTGAAFAAEFEAPEFATSSQSNRRAARGCVSGMRMSFRARDTCNFDPRASHPSLTHSQRYDVGTDVSCRRALVCFRVLGGESVGKCVRAGARSRAFRDGGSERTQVGRAVRYLVGADTQESSQRGGGAVRRRAQDDWPWAGWGAKALQPIRRRMRA